MRKPMKQKTKNAGACGCSDAGACGGSRDPREGVTGTASARAAALACARVSEGVCRRPPAGGGGRGVGRGKGHRADGAALLPGSAGASPGKPVAAGDGGKAGGKPARRAKRPVGVEPGGDRKRPRPSLKRGWRPREGQATRQAGHRVVLVRPDEVDIVTSPGWVVSVMRTHVRLPWVGVKAICLTPAHQNVYYVGVNVETGAGNSSRDALRLAQGRPEVWGWVVEAVRAWAREGGCGEA